MDKMNNLRVIIDAFWSAVPFAGMFVLIGAIIYVLYSQERRVSLAWKWRKAWIGSHFPEPEYTREYVGVSQFVAALLKNTEDTVIWQYYDKFDEARKVEGGYDKLCSLDCCAEKDSDPGSLFIVTGNKVEIAIDPYAVRVVLRIVLQYQKVRCWIQEQPQYAGFSLETVSLNDMNAALSAPGVSLWGYVSAWEDATFIPPERYDSINRVTYYTLFAIDTEAKRIYQPLLELTQDGE